MASDPLPEPGRLPPAVLQRVRNRDPEALGKLFELYFDRIYGLAYRLVGERSIAEDVAQEVFLKVHRAAHQLDPERDPAPWLLTITSNTCRDLYRSRAHRWSRRTTSLDADDDASALTIPDPRDPERDLIRAETQRVVQRALMDLPESLRHTIVLRDYEGLSHEEIAVVLDTSYAAVRKRYSRALDALGKLLGGGFE